MSVLFSDLFWRLGTFSPLLVYHAHSPRSAPKVEKKFADNWWGQVYQEISAKILKLIYDERGLLYQGCVLGCVGTLKGGRLYQEILRERKNRNIIGGRDHQDFFRGRTRRDGMVTMSLAHPARSPGSLTHSLTRLAHSCRPIGIVPWRNRGLKTIKPPIFLP